jgi:predicted nucleic acid-binding protein
LLAELADVIGRDKFDDILARTRTSRERSLDEVRRLTEIFDAPPLPMPVCRDPDDDAVLACAIAARVDLIVSGDQDLLVLKRYQGIPSSPRPKRCGSSTPRTNKIAPYVWSSSTVTGA